MSSQLKFFGHILRFEKDKPADIYTLQMMIMMISGMPWERWRAERKWRWTRNLSVVAIFKDKKNYATYLMSKARKQFYANFISEDS